MNSVSLSLSKFLKRIARKPTRLVRRFKHGRHAHAGRSRRRSDHPVSVTSSSPPANDVLAPSFNIELPVELWLEVIQNIPDMHSIGQLMRVSHAFYSIAEPFLYRTVTLASDGALILFFRSMSKCPRRREVIRTLHILVEDIDTRIPVLLAPLLQSLVNLEYLTLNLLGSAYLFARGGDSDSRRDILEIRIPYLRGLSTNLSYVSRDRLISFLQGHSKLEELHLTQPMLSSGPEWGPNLELPLLRRLSTRSSSFLGEHLSPPANLTHLNVTCLKVSEALRITRLVGSQLVSLRLGPTPSAEWMFASEPEAEKMTFYDVVEGFPRLRFFQVDMLHRDSPHLNHGVIDWHKDRPDINRTGSTRPRARTSRVTVAWVYERPGATACGFSDILQSAAAWHRFLNKAAESMFVRWGDCIERIIYRHTIIPYVSASVNKQGRLFRREAKDMHEDYWKRVEADSLPRSLVQIR